jgi:site-specific DNA-cytosine methylase
VDDILNAADYGVPQIRKRFVLHAVRKDISDELNECGFNFELPKPTHDKMAKADFFHGKLCGKPSVICRQLKREKHTRTTEGYTTINVRI